MKEIRKCQAVRNVLIEVKKKEGPTQIVVNFLKWFNYS